MARVPKFVTGHRLDAAVAAVQLARSAVDRRADLMDSDARDDALRGLGRDAADVGSGFLKNVAGAELGAAALTAAAGQAAAGGVLAAICASSLAPIAAAAAGGAAVHYGAKAVAHGVHKATDKPPAFAA